MCCLQNPNRPTKHYTSILAVGRTIYNNLSFTLEETFLYAPYCCHWIPKNFPEAEGPWNLVKFISHALTCMCYQWIQSGFYLLFTWPNQYNVVNINTGVCCGRNRWSRFLLTKSYDTGQESYYILLSCVFWLCPPSSNTLSWESPHWDTQLGAEGGQKSYWWQKYPEF